MLKHIILDTKLGAITLVADEDKLVGLYQEGQANYPDAGKIGEKATSAELAVASEELREYLNGGRKQFDLELAPQGTPFQMKVWNAIAKIPYGERATYLQIAEAIGNPKAVRAVASAVGDNPISIVIPCHRVVAGSGAEKYSAPLENKIALINLENNSRYSS